MLISKPGEIPVGAIFHENDASDDNSKADLSCDNTRRSQTAGEPNRHKIVFKQHRDLSKMS